MARCGYKTQLPTGEWECPLDALHEGEYCYWHKEEDGKEPTEEQLEELKRNTIAGVYLRKANLGEANLQGSNLSWADLKKSNLSRANLQGSDLFGAKLQEAALFCANLQGSNLYSANLQRSDLFGAKLQGADLSMANLRGADLAGTNFNFITVLSGSELVSAKLKGADLQGANLVGTKFNSQTALDNSTLIGANLFRSYFDEAKSFRKATVFQNEKDDKEINEITGDYIGGWFIWIFERMPKCMVNIVTKILKKKPYLFSWDNVPGIDSDKLSKYLKKYHGISWVESEEFDKSDDGKTIRIFKDENSSAEITVDEAEENVTLNISDGGIHNLTVKKENGKLNIYKKPNRYLHIKPYVLDVRAIENFERMPKCVVNIVTKILKKKPYLFSWDNVPGIDSDKLSKYLKKYHGISWVESEEFDKSDDGKTIRIFKDENSSAEITVDEAEENVTLNISDGGIHNLTVKKENGKLNIYKKPNRYLHIKPYVLDVGAIEKIEGEESDVATGLRRKGLIRYASEGYKIVFFDWQSGCVIKNPENGLWHKYNLIRVNGLTDLILKDGKVQPKFLHDGSRVSLYEASYEVYNNLYNFYIANGRLDQAAHVHYRRGEAHRKLRWARGRFKNRLRSIFDLLILRTLTGYGDKIVRPIFVSGLIVGLFAFLFRFFDGIVKNVNGTQVAPDWWDYFYHSITTFTSLGYSNIQPNLASEHWIWPQVLVAAESGLGVLMMALIIFVVTYQVSR